MRRDKYTLSFAATKSCCQEGSCVAGTRLVACEPMVVMPMKAAMPFEIYLYALVVLLCNLINFVLC
jgi:hypothetical protein